MQHLLELGVCNWHHSGKYADEKYKLYPLRSGVHRIWISHAQTPSESHMVIRLSIRVYYFYLSRHDFLLLHKVFNFTTPSPHFLITSHLLCWAWGGGATNSFPHVLYMGISYSHERTDGTLVKLYPIKNQRSSMWNVKTASHAPIFHRKHNICGIKQIQWYHNHGDWSNWQIDGIRWCLPTWMIMMWHSIND